MKLYHLYLINSKNKKIYLTAYPMSEKECKTLKGKLSDVTLKKVIFEEVN